MPRAHKYLNCKVVIFQPNARGFYESITGESGTLAEYLSAHGIENLPDGLEFMRIDNQYFNAWIYGGWQIKIKIFREYANDTKI